MLTKYYGFAEEDITVMIDTDDAYTKPTGANMKAKLKELIDGSVDGDAIFFHFSGHGAVWFTCGNDSLSRAYR
jgi:hypothetical protein